MIFHIFPYLLYHRFLVSNCSKFGVKKMGSTVAMYRKVSSRVPKKKKKAKKRKKKKERNEAKEKKDCQVREKR